MVGKRVLITGVTSGIGKATAKALAKEGAELILVGRDERKSTATLDEIRAVAPEVKATPLLADLSSQASIRKLAEEVKARYQRLDVLLNNAGLVLLERRLTVDGLEATFATNHLAPFLLTNLLLDLMIASAPARIVTVSSAVHRRGNIPFDDLRYERQYSGFLAYSDSKLANVLFTYELARRLAGHKITANCLHPGVVATGFGRNEGAGWMRHVLPLVAPFFLSAAKGAQTSIYLASSPDVADVSGRYFAKCRPVPSSKRSQDRALAERLWQVSAELTGLPA